MRVLFHVAAAVVVVVGDRVLFHVAAAVVGEGSVRVLE